MLTYSLEQRGGMPMCNYLYRCIKDDILRGKLSPGEKLPSKRELAQHLKISVATTENAYAQLIDEGYAYAAQRRGYFVSEAEKRPPAQLRPTATAEHDAPREYFMDFKTNSVGAERFPFSVWSRLTRETLLEQGTGILKSAPYNGIRQLREAIAEYLYCFRGMSVGAEQIIIGAGSEYLYNLIIQLLGADKVFAVENPGYGKIAQVYEANGVQYEYIELDELGISVKKLRDSGADVVHISPSHHYPTGIVTPAPRRQEILRWANESPKRYVIEDDYDSEFRFAGRPIQTMRSVCTNENVIYMNTFSKTLAPSMRIGYMVLPPRLLEIYRERLGFYTCSVSAFEQYTLAKFIGGGYFEKHISRMKKFYRAQKAAVIEAIRSSRFAARAEITEENAGLHFLLKLDTELCDNAVVAIADSAGIRIACLSEYVHGDKTDFQHCVVVNYSGIDAARLPETVKRLERGLYAARGTIK